MPKYLIQAKYQVEGIKGLLKEGGSARRAAVEKAAQSLGGKVESFNFGFGGSDAFVVAELPDNAAAAGFALVANATGAASVTTTVLITPEEMDQAVKKSPAYRAPGQ